MINRKLRKSTILITTLFLISIGMSHAATFEVPPPDSYEGYFIPASVAENQPAGTEVIRFRVNNPNGDTLHFYMDLMSYPFTYEYTNNEFIIKTDMVLDYEFDNMPVVDVFPATGFLIGVKVWSNLEHNATPPYPDEDDCISIIVNIINDPSDDNDPVNVTPMFTHDGNITLTIPQNTAEGVNIGAPVVATDADGDNLTYRIPPPYDVLTGVSLFSIDSATGQLQTAGLIDTVRDYFFMVYVEDGKGGFDITYVDIGVEESAAENNQIRHLDNADTKSQLQISQQQATTTEKPTDQTQPNKNTENATGVLPSQNNNPIQLQQNTEDVTNPDTSSDVTNPDTSSEKESTVLRNTLSATGEIGFSEIMYVSNGGVHSDPQWIELYNNSSEEIDLTGWQLEIEARDKDGTHRSVTITLENMSILPKQTVLIVTWLGRTAGEIPDSQIYNFFDHHADEFDQNKYRNMVIGSVGFYLKLSDPNGTVSDVVGNLDGDTTTNDEPTWQLPEGTTEDGARTSMMRRYSKEEGVPLDGTSEDNWVLSSDIGLSVVIYWGKTTDIGNPGFRGSGALPVQLSSFHAKLTNTGVVIKWTTESELENAGFNILRSNSLKGPFEKVNQELIKGAGTTGERNTYEWIDTTAKMNIEYYYQIEDVSFAGVRETHAKTRMKGILSAKHRYTTRWSVLKSRQ